MTAGPPSLTNNPRLSRWLELTSDGYVLVRSGKAELGQGVLTALAQIAAEELDVDIRRVRMLPVRTGASPDESYTSGSLSIAHSGAALRQICAEARAALIEAAANALDVRAEQLRVSDGDIVADDGRHTSYWEFAGSNVLDRAVSGAAAAKRPAEYTVVGRNLPRRDLADKVMGRPRFIHDLRFPGQLHGRVVRPPSPGAVLLDVDVAAAEAMDHVVAVVRDGSFLGVIADREDVALRAADVLRAAASWREAELLPDETSLADYLLTAPAQRTVLHEAGMPPRAQPARTIRGRFTRPFLAHASLAPSCGVAVWLDTGLRVWSHSQGVYNLARELARSFELAEEDVVVEHAEGAGCYGHNGADDAAYDAAILARAVPGRHVAVVWSRADELTWSPFGPAMVVDIEVDVDDNGAPSSWRHDIWGNGHSSRPSSPGLPPLLAATTQDPPKQQAASLDPPMANGGGSGRNSVPLYDLPSVCVTSHRLDVMPLRTSAMRALGAHLNVFAIESIIDELAQAARADPVDYRLSLLRDDRARAVLETAAERSGWEAGTGTGGRGVGLARYKGVGAWCAVVADIEAEAEVRVTRLTIAVDVGLVVNPDGVVNQIEGGALQAVGWTTKEQVRFDRRHVTSATWADYPVLTFVEVPDVDVVLIDRPDQPSLGAGETSVGPTAAAIGNAVRDALGFPVRTLPLTPANVIAAMP